jgi:hypothetical protein
MFFLKSREEKIMNEKEDFESWANLEFPLIGLLFSFNEKDFTYKDKNVNQMWAGWLGGRGFF